MHNKTRNLIKKHLRKISRMRKEVYEVVKASKKYEADGTYKSGKKKGQTRYRPVGHVCESCQDVVQKVEVDHIVEIGSFPLRPCGRPDWNKWIDDLFCGPENLQVLCPDCHRDKTAAFNTGEPKGEYYV